MIFARKNFRILGVLVVVSLYYQHFLFSQNPVVPLITENYDRQAIPGILDSLAVKYGLRIYKRESVSTASLFSGSFYRTPVPEVLRTILSTTDFRLIAIDNRTFFLSPISNADHGQMNRYLLTKAKLQQEPDFGSISIGHQDSMLTEGLAHVQGHIINSTDDSPVALVSVKLDELVTTTDSNGIFTLMVQPGKYTLRVQSDRFSDFNQPIKVYGHGTIGLKVFERTIDLPELVVGADAGLLLKQANSGVAQLSLREIQRLPALMGESDVIKSLMTLPGVSNTGDIGSGYHVRGGTIDQNLVLQDGVAYLNTSHVLGLFSSFNTDAIKNVTLYKGHIPAQYGGRISSVLDIKLKDPAMENWNFHGGLGPVSSKLFAEGPIIQNKTSMLAGLRMSYSDWVLGLLRDENLKNSQADFYDFNLKINHHFKPGNNLSLSAYGSNDNFKYANDFGFGWQTQSLSGMWTYDIKPGINLQTSAYWSANRNNFLEIDNGIDYRISNGMNMTNGKVKLGWQLSRAHFLQTGLEWTKYTPITENYQVKSEQSTLTKESYPKTSGQEAAVFIQDEFNISERLNLSLGYRHSVYCQSGPAEIRQYQPNQPRTTEHVTGTQNYPKHSRVKMYHSFEPRFSLAYSLGPETSVKLSYNRLSQYIHLVSNTMVATPVDIWKLSDFHITPQRSNNYSLGYFKNMANNRWITSLELYFRQTKDELEYKDFARLLRNEFIETEIFAVDGRSFGAEVFIKKALGDFKGHFAYTISRTLRRSRGDYPDEVINNGRFYASNFDKPHSFNAVLDWQIRKTMAWSANFVLNSGRPTTAPTASYTQGEGGVFFDYSDRNEFRIPVYHRLDMSLTVTRAAIRTKKFKGSWTFSLYNVYNRRNAFSVFYRKKFNEPPLAYKLSILGSVLPSVTYNFQF